MVKHKGLFFLKVFFVLFLICSSNVKAHKGNHDIVVTIKPLYSLVQSVLGDTQKAQLLVPGGISPHDFQVKPSHIRLLQNSKAVFYIEETFVNKMQKVLKNLPKNIKKISVIKAKGVEVLERRTKAIFQESHHEEHHDDDHHHHHVNKDLHIWLSPDNAIAITKYIARNLSIIYPNKTKIYRKNAFNTIKKLKKLKIKVKKKLEVVSKVPFMVFHDAYQYFEKSFGLNTIGSLTFEPHMPLNIKRLRKIKKAVKKHKVKCVFAEPEFSDKVVRTVSEKTKIKTSVLDPLGSKIQLNKNLYFNLIDNISNKIIETCPH